MISSPLFLLILLMHVAHFLGDIFTSSLTHATFNKNDFI